MAVINVHKGQIKSLIASMNRSEEMLQKFVEKLQADVFDVYFSGDVETAASNLERIAGKKITIFDAFNMMTKSMKSMTDLRIKIDTTYGEEQPDPVGVSDAVREMCMKHLIRVGKLEQFAGAPKSDFSYMKRGPSFDHIYE